LLLPTLGPLSTGTLHEWRVEVSGLDVTVGEAGSGECVVVLHHSTGPLWTPFLDVLSENVRVVAPDIPGYGKSERPDWARHPRDLAIVVLQFLDLLDVESVNLVGFGFGGWIAAELATMAHRRLLSLVLVGAAGIQPRPGQGEIHDPMLLGFEDYVRLGFHNDDSYTSMFGEYAEPELVLMWDLSREMTARLTWKPWMFSHEMPHLLYGVHTPTLLVWGDDDRVIPLDCALQYESQLRNARLEVVANSGHAVDLDRPDQLAALVLAHIGAGS
jgi:pimeloyl-ACP methyl ester carboxylesterase